MLGGQGRLLCVIVIVILLFVGLFCCSSVQGLGPCVLSSGKEESEGRSRPHCVIVIVILLLCKGWDLVYYYEGRREVGGEGEASSSVFLQLASGTFQPNFF